MTLRLNNVRHEVDYDGTHRFQLTYIQGREEARVTAKLNEDGTAEAECETLDADSLMDEIVLEEHAHHFAEEHGRAFGEVDL